MGVEHLSPGTRIIIALSNPAAMAMALSEAYEAGLVVIPMDSRSPQLDWVAEHSEAAAIWSDDLFGNYSERLPSPETDAYIIYTSGSTGDPKGVILTRANVEHNASAVAKEHKMNEGPHATCLPLYHVNALMMSLHATRLASSELILADSDPERYFEAIARSGAITASIVPALLHRLVEVHPPWPRSLRYLITAAAPLTSDLARRFFELYGPRIRQGWGLSETVNFTCLMPLLDDDEFRRECIEQWPPVGYPLPEIGVRVVNHELQVKGPTVFRGYWHNPLATAAAFTEDGWLHTGDLGEWRGLRIVITGRAKEVINRGGETIYPREVEERWRAEGAGDCVALAVAHPVLSDDIGLWTISEKLPPLTSYRPVAVQTGVLQTTSTGKPRRRAMAAALPVEAVSVSAYEALVREARAVAIRLESWYDGGEPSLQGQFIENWVRAMAKVPEPNSVEPVPEHIRQFLRLLKYFDPLTQTGEALVKRDLWIQLMTEPPMFDYAVLAARFLKARARLTGKIMELGSGVGNLLRALGEQPDHFFRTDHHRALLGHLTGEVALYDFDQPGKWRELNTIVAVNALHCAALPSRSLAYAYEMLAPGGLLLLAEGEPEPRPGEPWALTGAFGMMGGWWDRGGFRARSYWLESLYSVGFIRRGYSMLRAGPYDLGGLVWAYKKE